MTGLIDAWPGEADGLARDDGGNSLRGTGVCPDATLTKRISSKQAVAATEKKKNLVNQRQAPPGGVPDVWQGKDL